MASFIDLSSLDCDLNEFEGIFDDDNDDLGFKKLIAQVTYDNDQLILSPIASRCISPIIVCDAIRSFPYYGENTLPSHHETARLGIVSNGPPDVAIQASLFQELETTNSSCVTDSSVYQISTLGQRQDSGVVGNVPVPQNQPGTKTSKSVRVCHKVTPALSAYNFFFRDERDRILSGGGTYNWSRERQELLLQRHWQQDRSQKRRHVKTHGKINFATLSKSISTSWKQLPESCKEFYREISLRDWDRFRKESSELEEGAP